MIRNVLILFIAATATAARPHLRRSPLLAAEQPTTAAAEAVHRMVVRDRGGYTIATRFAAAEAAVDAQRRVRPSPRFGAPSPV